MRRNAGADPGFDARRRSGAVAGAGALARHIELKAPIRARTGPLLGKRGVTPAPRPRRAARTADPGLGSAFVVASGRWDRDRGFSRPPPISAIPPPRAPVSTAGSGLCAGSRRWPAMSSVAGAGSTWFPRRRSCASRADRPARAGRQHRGRRPGEWQFDAARLMSRRAIFEHAVISSTRFVPVLDQRSTPSTGIGVQVRAAPADCRVP